MANIEKCVTRCETSAFTRILGHLVPIKEFTGLKFPKISEVLERCVPQGPMVSCCHILSEDKLISSSIGNPTRRLLTIGKIDQIYLSNIY